MSTDTDRIVDVAVIGGGPAGSTTATLLAEKGWQVVLFEKDRFPRFHIGESLLPMNLPILERLGVLDQVREIGVVKYGADFGPDVDGNGLETIYFAEALDKNHPYAFQVKRAEFDKLLLDNAVRQGVEVHQGVRVSTIDLGDHAPSRLQTTADDGTTRHWQARFVVDASGRDTLLSRKLGLKQKNDRHQSAAIFGHFKNVTRRPGKDGGNIGIYWFKHGWFWMIPLRDDTMSVGAVCWPSYLKTRRTGIAEFLQQTIALCPPVRERMQDARLIGEARATGNYSYRASRMTGDNYLLVGDAFAFVDPVFSSGVYFAMNGATLAADAVDCWLTDPAAAGPALRRFERQVRHGIGTVSWFIYRFTSPAMQRLFMAPRNVFRIKEALISMLAGDVFRNTPITRPLLLFKGIYRLTSLATGWQGWNAYRHRRNNVNVTFTGGTTSQDPQ